MIITQKRLILSLITISTYLPLSAFAQMPQYGQPAPSFDQPAGKRATTERVQRAPSATSAFESCRTFFEKPTRITGTAQDFAAGNNCIETQARLYPQDVQDKIKQLLTSFMSANKVDLTNGKRWDRQPTKSRFEARLKQIFETLESIENAESEGQHRVKRAPHDKYPTFSDFDNMSPEDLDRLASTMTYVESERLLSILTEARSKQMLENARIVSLDRQVTLASHSYRDPVPYKLCKPGINPNECAQYLNKIAKLNRQISIADSYLQEHERLARRGLGPSSPLEESLASAEGGQ